MWVYGGGVFFGCYLNILCCFFVRKRTEKKIYQNYEQHKNDKNRNRGVETEKVYSEGDESDGFFLCLRVLWKIEWFVEILKFFIHNLFYQSFVGLV